MLKLNQTYKFYEEVKAEAKKVTWPTRKDMIRSTIVVLLTIVIVSLVCAFADLLIYNIIYFLLKL
jgi:preprotein translocase subunit SecE